LASVSPRGGEALKKGRALNYESRRSLNTPAHARRIFIQAHGSLALNFCIFLLLSSHLSTEPKHSPCSTCLAANNANFPDPIALSSSQEKSNGALSRCGQRPTSSQANPSVSYGFAVATSSNHQSFECQIWRSNQTVSAPHYIQKIARAAVGEKRPHRVGYLYMMGINPSMGR
jgi:hypothetical protein